MDSFFNKLEKYNITKKKLFDAILRLSQERQTQLLIYVEELITENKRISNRKAYGGAISGVRIRIPLYRFSSQME